MKTILQYLFNLLLFGSLFYGCATSDATIKKYSSPSLNSSKITSVAIFPLRNAFVQTNASLGTGEMLEINKMFQVEFANKNAKTQLINSTSSIELLNKVHLVNSYDTLLTVYGNTGIPNTQILERIGHSLKVNAIIQGFVVQVFQRDGNGAMFGEQIIGEAKITVKYVMFSTTTGETLWEIICNGSKSNPTTSAPAPTADVIELMREKIISELPTLSMQ